MPVVWGSGSNGSLMSGRKKEDMGLEEEKEESVLGVFQLFPYFPLKTSKTWKMSFSVEKNSSFSKICFQK